MMIPSLQHTRILVVDDNESNTMLLHEVLSAEGHIVDVAHNGLEAMESIAANCPDLIVLDLDMPIMDGYEVCRRVKGGHATQLIPVIIITAQTALDAKLHAWELGADDFLTKPYHCLEVVARCRSLLRVKRLVDELDSAESVVFAFARAVEAKSPYTQGHAERVAAYALVLAAEIGVPEADWETLRKGAILHDVGKISTPDAILDKPGPLTAAEFELVKQHTSRGALIVESLRSIRDCIPMIRWHHERMDGTGYPDKLTADRIPPLVRVLAVADVFDSLSSGRPYRGPIPHAVALDILRENAAGGGLDPDLVCVFTEMFKYGIPSSTRPAERMRQAIRSAPRGNTVNGHPNPIPHAAQRYCAEPGGTAGGSLPSTVNSVPVAVDGPAAANGWQHTELIKSWSWENIRSVRPSDPTPLPRSNGQASP